MKQQSLWNEVKGEEIVNQIKEVKLDEFKKFVKNLFSGKMCFVLKSAEVSSVYKYEEIKKKFT